MRIKRRDEYPLLARLHTHPVSSTLAVLRSADEKWETRKRKPSWKLRTKWRFIFAICVLCHTPLRDRNATRRAFRATQINFAIISKLWLPLLFAHAASAATLPHEKWNKTKTISVRRSVEFGVLRNELRVIKIERRRWKRWANEKRMKYELWCIVKKGSHTAHTANRLHYLPMSQYSWKMTA